MRALLTPRRQIWFDLAPRAWWVIVCSIMSIYIFSSLLFTHHRSCCGRTQVCRPATNRTNGPAVDSRPTSMSAHCITAWRTVAANGRWSPAPNMTVRWLVYDEYIIQDTTYDVSYIECKLNICILLSVQICRIAPDPLVRCATADQCRIVRAANADATARRLYANGHHW